MIEDDHYDILHEQMKENCKDCVHFYIWYYKKCGECGKHLHDKGREVKQ